MHVEHYEHLSILQLFVIICFVSLLLPPSVKQLCSNKGSFLYIYIFLLFKHTFLLRTKKNTQHCCLSKQYSNTIYTRQNKKNKKGNNCLKQYKDVFLENSKTSNTTKT